jgi:hypothetical protein
MQVQITLILNNNNQILISSIFVMKVIDIVVAAVVTECFKTHHAIQNII